MDNITIGKSRESAEKFDEYRKEYAATIEDLNHAATKMRQFCVNNAANVQKSKHANLIITNKLKKMMEKEKEQKTDFQRHKEFFRRQ